jgi:hypothetical protein
VSAAIGVGSGSPSTPADHNIRQVAWFVDAQPPKHEQLLDVLWTA